jgi:hypothetical protein
MKAQQAGEKFDGVEGRTMTRLVAGQAAGARGARNFLSPILSICGDRRLLVFTKFLPTLRRIQGGRAASSPGATEASQGSVRRGYYAWHTGRAW